MTRIIWTGEQQVIARMGVYEGKIYEAIRAVADYFKPIVEAYAKDHAGWVDRSGNARQGLHAEVENLAKDVVALYLAHGVEYGKYLELRWSGRYAIILPTFEAHYGQIVAMLREVFG